MPKVDAGTGESGDRTSGEMIVVPGAVAQDVIEGRDDRPPALKVIFNAAKGDGKASYAVPIGDPEEARFRLQPFTDGEPDEYTEEALRRHIAANSKPGPFHVRTWGDYIQSFLAGVGEHVGYLSDLRLTKNGDRVWFTLRSLEGLESDFPAPWPPVVCTKGKTPAEDSIGGYDEDGKKLLRANHGPFPYLIKCGLDWNRWAMEDGELATAPALWPGHYDANLDPILSYLDIGEGFPPQCEAWCYFGSMNDLTPELFDATVRHGLKAVSWDVVMDPKYGLSVKRGDFFFEIGKATIVGGGGPAPAAANVEFEREKAVFLEVWDNLTKVVLAKDDARFMAGGKFTEEGKQIAKGILAPLVRNWPGGMRKFRADGSPEIHLPPTEEAWNINAVVAANVTAERLMRLGEEERFAVVSLTDPAPLLAWAAEAVPEWAGAGLEESEGELL